MGIAVELAALPDETVIYCGHEYTEANARFALTIEPGNADLVKRAAEVSRLRAAGKATLPTTIGLEKKTNPFLRANEPSVRAAVGLPNAPAAQVFAEVRKRKDNFQQVLGVSAAGTSPARPARRRRQSGSPRHRSPMSACRNRLRPGWRLKEAAPHRRWRRSPHVAVLHAVVPDVEGGADR